MIDLHRMRFLINRLPMARYRVDVAMSRATKVTSVITGMPHGGTSGDAIPDGVEKLMMCKEAYENIKRELTILRAELEPIIDKLEDPLERNVMVLRYMEGRRVQDISNLLNYSERWIFRKLQSAEKRVQALQ